MLLHLYNSFDHFFPQGVKSQIKNAVAGTKHIAKVKANVFIFEAFKLFTKFHKYAPHALKGQKLLAQGNTLGMHIEMVLTPCKGKSFYTAAIF
mgnify:FL=1